MHRRQFLGAAAAVATSAWAGAGSSDGGRSPLHAFSRPRGIERADSADDVRLGGAEPVLRHRGVLSEPLRVGPHDLRRRGAGSASALRGLDPKRIGCQCDIRHAVAEAGGSWEIALQPIAPFIGSICLKDFIWSRRKDRWAPETVFAGEPNEACSSANSRGATWP